jgi:hypothetical protein
MQKCVANGGGCAGSKVVADVCCVWLLPHSRTDGVCLRNACGHSRARVATRMDDLSVLLPPLPP